ncbi:MAG: Gfo/Idh/MocA family oxidoreductase [Oscillospiraceae bacterium]|nr:Gfo/Idh/MocA family oxidoreductase [Oscillospiraceae bacterium]
MAAKVKIGIIGCGGIANTKHLLALGRQTDRVELTAFCDLIPERAQKAAEQYGVPGAKVYTDYKELLKDSSIEAVHVLTPNRWHREMTVNALEAGKHVMCEKPMAINPAEAMDMVNAAKRTGKLLAIGYQYRQRNDALTLKRMADAGDLGDIYYARGHAVRFRGVPTWGVFTNKLEQGGGPLIDIGTHSLDLALWVMNNYKPSMVLGSVFNYLGTSLKPGEQGNRMGAWDPDTYEVEDSAFGMVKMANGATIYLEAAWALNMADCREGIITVCGTRSGATMEIAQNGDGGWRTDKQLVISSVVADTPAETRPSVATPRPDAMGPHDRECANWLDAIQTGSPLLVQPEQAYTVTRILDGIYQSNRDGKAVTFAE